MKVLGLTIGLCLFGVAAAAQSLSGPPVAAAPSLPGSTGTVGSSMPAMPMAAPASPSGGMTPGSTTGLGTTTPTATTPIPPAATAGITGVSGVIAASGGRIYQTTNVGDPTQGFMKLVNESSTADILLNSACPIADSTMLVGADGKPAGKLELEPGKPLILEPKGPHLTLKGTHFQIQNGSIVPCTLTFQNAGQIQVMLGWQLPPKG